MNVALTYSCNQRCKYCFGTDAMSLRGYPGPNREMTLVNLKKVMGFMRRSGLRIFNMIGGEPTLHSKFDKFFDTIARNGFSIIIFSNGVIDKEKVDFLSKQSKLKSIILNIREPKEYSANDFKKIEYTLSRMTSKVVLSFRIYKIDFDPNFLFDLIDRYKLNRNINWAIACPSLIKNNVYLCLEEYKEAVGRMLKFSRISKKRGISWYSDSGFILCAFNREKLKELKENTGFIPITNCFPAVEVAPDLAIFRCFGLAAMSRPDLKITDFHNLKEAERYFYVKSLPLKRIGAMGKCFKCGHIKTRKCGGGCMVHILKRLPNFKKAIF